MINALSIKLYTLKICQTFVLKSFNEDINYDLLKINW